MVETEDEAAGSAVLRSIAGVGRRALEPEVYGEYRYESSTSNCFFSPLTLSRRRRLLIDPP